LQSWPQTHQHIYIKKQVSLQIEEIDMNVDRVESFRTSLMNQKQRLLKQTQIQSTFDKNLIEKDLKKKEDEKSAKSIIFGALRKISGGSRKSSKEAKTAQEECTSNTISEPSVTPALPLTPELLTINNLPQTPPPSPAEEVRKRTPVPSDSPLLSKVRQDPILKRIRSFNKSLKKASSFRQAREKVKNILTSIFK